MSSNALYPRCSDRCRCSAKDAKLPNGKFGRVYACQLPENQRFRGMTRAEALRSALADAGPVPADLAALIQKAVRS